MESLASPERLATAAVRLVARDTAVACLTRMLTSYAACMR